jgi:hypothetical protein
MSPILDPLVQSLNETWTPVLRFQPRLLAALLLLGLGWIVGTLRAQFARGALPTYLNDVGMAGAGVPYGLDRRYSLLGGRR